jgi:hypothetical protein
VVKEPRRFLAASLGGVVEVLSPLLEDIVQGGVSSRLQVQMVSGLNVCG